MQLRMSFLLSRLWKAKRLIRSEATIMAHEHEMLVTGGPSLEMPDATNSRAVSESTTSAFFTATEGKNRVEYCFLVAVPFAVNGIPAFEGAKFELFFGTYLPLSEKQ